VAPPAARPTTSDPIRGTPLARGSDIAARRFP